ncbi:hypoxanthine phosphoribosyltransferase [Pseudonocardia sp. UM4_GMWB1]|uniref:hypoxanthine phosphoribosyltransferase n=1 Tax=Pseudonocardia sp. UM4_GMWB1 TaxID=2212989 RepID=UPI00307E7A36
MYDGDISSVLVTEEQVREKTAELAQQVAGDYADLVRDGRESDLVLIGVLKGAVMFMTDFARALPIRPSSSSWRSAPTARRPRRRVSCGSSRTSTATSAGRHVLIVEDIIDSGLTLNWLLGNLQTRSPASLEVVTLLRKPDAVKVDVPVRYVGFDIPNEFVVGYGLDYAERYRDLPYIGTLDPSVYA